MTYQEYLKNEDKSTIYSTYIRIISNYQDYEKITKKQMIQDIIDFYNQKEAINKICNTAELELLSKIIKKKMTYFKIIKKKYGPELIELLDKYIVFEDPITKKIHIPQEIAKNVKETVKKRKKQSKLDTDAVNLLLVMIIKFYGILEETKFFEIINNYMKIEKNLFQTIINESTYFHFYAFKYNQQKKSYWIYQDYRSLKEEFMMNYKYYQTLDYKIVSLEDLLDYFDNPFYTVEKEDLHQLEVLAEEEGYSLQYIVEEIMRCSILVYNVTKIEKYIKQKNRKITSEQLENIRNLLYNIIDNMPSVALKGYTPKEYTRMITKKHYEEKYKKTYANLENKEEIEEYQSLREETDELVKGCAQYLVKDNLELFKKYQSLCTQYKVEPNLEQGNILDNFIIFHALEKNQIIPFSKYVQEKLNVLSKAYSYAWQVEDTLIETLFQIKELNPKKGKVKLEDIKTNKTYEIYDISLSSSSKDILKNYMFTTLITINNMTFANGYALLFEKERHPNILKEIKEIKENIKEIDNEKTKEFIAYYLLFKNS